MRRFRSILMTAVTAAATLVLIVMMLHTVASTASRSLFNRPLEGTYEISEFWYLPLVSLFGLLAAHLNREHIQVHAFTELLPPAAQRVSHLLIRVLGALTCLGIGVATLVKGLEDARVGTTAGLTDIPAWPPLLVIPVVFLVYGILLLLPEPPVDADDAALAATPDPAPRGEIA